MTVNQWLNEHYPDGFIDGIQIALAMERYANYVSKNYQVKIMAFRNELDNLDSTAGGTIIICPEGGFDGFEVKSYYDNFFGIETLRHGTE